MVFCNDEAEFQNAVKTVTILILIDGFLQYDVLLVDIDTGESQSLF